MSKGYKYIPVESTNTRRRRANLGTGDEDDEKWSIGCLAASGVSIAGGTDEVQRNIIGERVLSLPKEPDPYKGASWDSVPRN